MKPCPACGSKNTFKEYCPVSFLKGDKRWIEECSKCGLSRITPLPTQRELNAFYHAGYYDFNRHSEEGKGYTWARYLKSIKRKGRFLDIGCATGFFLNGVKQHCDWEVYGQEMGKEAASFARSSLGLDVRGVPLEKAKFPKNYFDFIHFNNVLEHVLDPGSIMKEVGRILKPGGRLFISTPNGRVNRHGFMDYHRKVKRRAASGDGHLYFYTPLSLRLLAEKSGLKIEKAFGIGLKRSLRVLGLWPKKRDWKKEYQGRKAGEKSVEKAVTEGKARPKLYYLFKHGKENLLRAGGFPKWAYDFNLYLRK